MLHETHSMFLDIKVW